MGNHKEAIPDYDVIIKADPKNAEAYYNRGISKMNVQDFKSGCDDFRKAVELGYKPAEQMVNIYCPKENK
jgi:tetratricopeptide (TPR) repeat protein